MINRIEKPKLQIKVDVWRARGPGVKTTVLNFLSLQDVEEIQRASCINQLFCT